MAFNIKNEEAHKLARQLAKMTGETMTQALIKALRAQIERTRKERGAGGLAERLMKISRECAPLWKEPYRSTDHGDLLYDEKGLPK